ncbi:MAG: hypothetical protein AB2L24_28955 [Mangrovibacterium sp.]
MWKSVCFKEWLKIRWFLAGFTLLGILGVGYVVLMVQHGITFSSAKNFWYNILFMRLQYYGWLKCVPLFGGIAMAVAQYFPETVNRRIKLIFHLPVQENRIILMMHAFGTGCLVASYLIILGLFVALSRICLPAEIVSDAVVSVYPWFLAGLTAYFLVALVVLEPVWKYRFLYALIGGLFLPVYLMSPATAAYGPANAPLTMFTVLLSIALLFSAYRFRKGEM